jgi:glycine/D-amino acid oxidase-like deaminating enzyme
VIVCANAWAAALLPALQGSLTPIRGQMLATSPLPALVRTGFSAQLTPTEEYGQQLPSGELVFGGCRALAPDHDRGVTALEVSAEVQAGLDQALTRLFPRLPAFTVTHRWAGVMAWTRDHQPILDRLPDAPVFFSAGFSGHGLPFAGTFARWLADAVISGQLPAEAQPYRLTRSEGSTSVQ